MKLQISKKLLIAATIVIVILFGFIKIIINQNKKLKELNNLYEVSQQSATIYKNVLGQQVYKIGVLTASNDKLLKNLATKDAVINELKALIESEKKKRHDVEVAIVIKTNTIYNLKDSLKNAIKGYTTVNDTVYPIYTKTTKGQWLSQNISMGRDCFEQKLTINNNYTVVIGDEPAGLFKKKRFAEITNLNPYSSTSEMRVYEKTPVKNKTVTTGIKMGVFGIVIGMILKGI